MSIKHSLKVSRYSFDRIVIECECQKFSIIGSSKTNKNKVNILFLKHLKKPNEIKHYTTSLITRSLILPK